MIKLRGRFVRCDRCMRMSQAMALHANYAYGGQQVEGVLRGSWHNVGSQSNTKPSENRPQMGEPLRERERQSPKYASESGRPPVQKINSFPRRANGSQRVGVVLDEIASEFSSASKRDTHGPRRTLAPLMADISSGRDGSSPCRLTVPVGPGTPAELQREKRKQ